jgi:hypothetical protein
LVDAGWLVTVAVFPTLAIAMYLDLPAAFCTPARLSASRKPERLSKKAVLATRRSYRIRLAAFPLK